MTSRSAKATKGFVVNIRGVPGISGRSDFWGYFRTLFRMRISFVSSSRFAPIWFQSIEKKWRKIRKSSLMEISGFKLVKKGNQEIGKSGRNGSMTYRQWAEFELPLCSFTGLLCVKCFLIAQCTTDILFFMLWIFKSPSLKKYVQILNMNQLHLAVKDVQSEKVSIRNAAQLHEVAKSTLFDHVKQPFGIRPSWCGKESQAPETQYRQNRPLPLLLLIRNSRARRPISLARSVLSWPNYPKKSENMSVAFPSLSISLILLLVLGAR